VERLILARHGESDLSVRGIANGDPARSCALTDAGRAQARRLGELVADEPLDLCVTTVFERTRETADLALAGREVPRLVVPELNDIRFGDFESLAFAQYRAWARSATPTDEPPGDGESRAAVVARYVRGFRAILGRPERLALVVVHGLPIRYVLNALAGTPPAPILEQVPYAEPYAVSADELEGALRTLGAWTAAPAWAQSQP
jgi:broad specificity phosphatase PhoE